MNVVRTSTDRLAFTLVEVLVVLALLAITTTIAVQSLGPVAAQAHHEVTLRALDSVKNSVVSSTGSTVAGFLVDTGRLPVSTAELTGIDPASGQSFIPHDLTTFTNATFNMNTSSGATMQIILPTGWNGGYVQPGAGMTTIVDGWSQPLVLTPTVPVVISSVNQISPVSVTVPLSSLQASSVTVQAVDSSGNPKTILGTIAWFGAGPANSALPSFSTFSSSTDGNIHTYSVPIPAQNGVINVSTRGLQTTTQTSAVSSAQLCPTNLDPTHSPPDVPLIGPRMFCVLTTGSSGGTPQISYGPVYQVIRPGSNTVVLPPAP